MLNALADFTVRFRWPIVVLFAAITAFFARQLPRAEIEPALKAMLPQDLPARANLDKIEEIFGGTEMILVVISAQDVLAAKTLERAKKISKAMERVKEFDKVVSLFTLKDIKGEGGSMIVDPAVRRIPKSEKRREALRADLKDNDMIYGSVLSKDFKHTAIVGFLNFKATDEVVLQKVEQIISDTPGPEAVEIGGMPFVRVHVGKDIRSDLRRFMPVGLGIMLVFLFVCFRQLRGVLLPAIVTVMAIVFSMGLIPLVGWKIQMVTVILPVFLIAVANDYGIHVLARYQEDNRPGRDLTSHELARSGVRELAKPILATGITTVVGVLCLLTHIVIPAKQMGVLAAGGVVYALLGSLLFIPAVLAILPRAKPVLADPGDADAKVSLLDRLLRGTAAAAARRPKGILIAVAVSIAPVAWGITFLTVDTNPINYYQHDAPVARASNLINDHLGGSLSISVVAEGDVKDPSVMGQIDQLETHLEKHPNVDITTSIAKVVRKMNQVMNDGDEAFDKIPDTREAIAQYFLLYSMSGEPDDFDKLVDYPYRHAQVVARINDNSTGIAKEIVEYTHEYISSGEDRPFTMVGGFADLFYELVGHIVRGQVLSLVLSMLLVGALVAILFRSVVAGLLATIPLALSMLLLFGLMGYIEVELNAATALLSSIMIGVGVDYTIHYLWRYKSERQQGFAPTDAIKTTLTTTGRGIVFNALSVVVGFAVLTISSFVPVQFFGILVLVSISACLLGALVVLPAVSLVFRPSFLEPANSPNEKETSKP